ncbi:class F sortase, partial [Actinospica acidiphila]|nr:class F sortase [Actinospica acidiphila]
MRRRFRRTGSPGNAAIAAVTVCALCAGAVLLRDGRGGTPPQPSAAQAHSELDAHG